METYKLLLAASKYCAQFDPILHMLPELFREYRTSCAGVVQSSSVCAGCSCCRQCRAVSASHVQSDQDFFVVSARCSFGVNKNSIG